MKALANVKPMSKNTIVMFRCDACAKDGSEPCVLMANAETRTPECPFGMIAAFKQIGPSFGEDIDD